MGCIENEEDSEYYHLLYYLLGYLYNNQRRGGMKNSQEIGQQL